MNECLLRLPHDHCDGWAGASNVGGSAIAFEIANATNDVTMPTAVGPTAPPKNPDKNATRCYLFGPRVFLLTYHRLVHTLCNDNL